MTVTRRLSIIEAENDTICEGQLPEAYEVVFEPADGIISIGVVGAEAIEFTAASWCEVEQEVARFVKGNAQ